MAAGNIFNTIILLGALQGIIMGALLLRAKEKILANRLLAFLILLIALASLNIFLMETNRGSLSWLLNLQLAVPLILVFPVGPLLYFYVQSLLDPGFVITAKKRLHFYPVLLDLVPYLATWLLLAGLLPPISQQQQQSFWQNLIEQYNMFIDIPRWISVSAYTWLAYKRIQEHGQHTKDPAVHKWPRQLVFSWAFFQVIWLLHLVPYIIPATSNILLHTLGWYPIYVPLTVMVYWLGINGYFIRQRQDQSARLKPPILAAEVSAPTMAALDKAMQQDRLFLEPALTLNQVAKHTDIAPKIITAVLNQHQGKSFNEYVNAFRITEVKHRIPDAKYQHLTLSGIAFECGFNSQATFHRTFRQHTGMSPGAFKEEISKIMG
jgi:AraC-like DNA-binding protein